MLEGRDLLPELCSVSMGGQGVTYLLMGSLPTAQMAPLRAARRLSAHQKKVETAAVLKLEICHRPIYWM